ncbi:MAG: hypothetical protein ABIT37_06555 [Luteolibacter sp.]
MLLDFLRQAALLKASQDPEVVAQDGPTNHQFAMREASRSGGFAHEVANEYADPGFGSGTAFESFAHAGFVLQSIAWINNVAWTWSAADSMVFQKFFVRRAVQCAVAPDVADGEVL